MTERRQGAPDPDEPVEFPEPSVRGAAFPQAGATAQAEARVQAGAPAEDGTPTGGEACAQGGSSAEGGALMTDLSEVRRTDALFDALAERRAIVLPEGDDPSARTDPRRPGLPAGLAAPFTLSAASPKWALHDPDDPAVRLLSALIRDIDEPAPVRRGTVPEPVGFPSPVGSSGASRASGPGDPADASGAADPAERCGSTGSTASTGAPGAAGKPGSPNEDDRPHPPSGPRRRGPRTIVALGVAGAVLASTGVAAAGGGLSDQPPLGPGAAETAGDAGTSEAAEHENSTALRPLAPVRPLPVSGPAERGTTRAAGEGADRRRRAAAVRARKALRDLRGGPASRSRLPGIDGVWPWTALPVLGGSGGCDDTDERTRRPREDRDDEDHRGVRPRPGSPRDAHDYDHGRRGDRD